MHPFRTSRLRIAGRGPMPVEQHIISAELAAVFDEREAQGATTFPDPVNPRPSAAFGNKTARIEHRKGVALDSISPPTLGLTVMVVIDFVRPVGVECPNGLVEINPRTQDHVWTR